MKIKVEWAGEAQFRGETESGHCITMDGPPDHGGKDKGPRPMETLLIGMGGCTSFDVMTILKKTRQDVVDCVAEISAERADDVPSVFTKIHVHFVVKGRGLKEAHVKRAVALSAEQYCSASIMLQRGGVEVTHGYELVEVE